MRAYLGRVFTLCLFAVLSPSLVMAASLPDGAAIRVNSFAFPQAVYANAKEDAEKLTVEFYSELASALQQTGLVVVAPVDVKEEPEAAEEETVPSARNETKERTTEEIIADEEDDLFTDSSADEEDGIIDDVVVTEGEKGTEKEWPEEGEKAPDVVRKRPDSKPAGSYIISGMVTRYEEQVGAPVSTGKTRRSRAEVTLSCFYQVKDPAGRVIISDETSASSTRIAAETVDIYVVLQNLKKKVFFDASHNIARRVSGKTWVTPKENAEPGSEDDEYADSPGKRLKSGSKSGPQTMKWTIR